MSELINIDMFYLFSAPAISDNIWMPRGKICQYTTPTPHEEAATQSQNQIYFPDTGLCPFKFVNLASLLINRVTPILIWEKPPTPANVSSAMTESSVGRCQLCELFTLKCSGPDRSLNVHPGSNGKLELCDTITTRAPGEKKKVSLSFDSSQSESVLWSNWQLGYKSALYCDSHCPAPEEMSSSQVFNLSLRSLFGPRIINTIWIAGPRPNRNVFHHCVSCWLTASKHSATNCHLQTKILEVLYCAHRIFSAEYLRWNTQQKWNFM